MANKHRNRGHSYERKIAKELKEIGFTGIVTSRAESKSMDDNKIDLVDKNNQLPCYIQIKKTMATPSYFAIEDKCTLKDKPFVIIWSKEVKKDVNFGSVGEIAMIPKSFFYQLIEQYGKL